MFETNACATAKQKINVTYSFPIHPLSTPWKIRKPWVLGFQGVEKGTLGTNGLTLLCGQEFIRWLKSPEAVPQRCSVKKLFSEISQIHTKTPVSESLFNKVAGLTLGLQLRLKRGSGRHRCFPVNFTKFLGTPFLKKHLQWLLLSLVISFNYFN